MNCDFDINERQKKLDDLKTILNEIDDKLRSITKDLNWDYEKLLNEEPSNMVTCSINSQHRVPVSKVKEHEERCCWRQKGYRDDDKPFSDHTGYGSFVTLTPETLEMITKDIPSTLERKVPRLVPETSSNLDQNFNREEKLAIYDFVIANTKKPNEFVDLCLQDSEKKEEKKEMSSWEIAAAERDAKRRRASYRNKVHTNRKTHTEILREVIDAQMEALREDNTTKPTPDEVDKGKHGEHKKHKHKHKHSREEKKYSESDSSRRRDKEEGRGRKNHDKHGKHRSGKRSPSETGSDSGSRSRDKYRKWKTYEGRSHSHKSSHSRRKS